MSFTFFKTGGSSSGRWLCIVLVRYVVHVSVTNAGKTHYTIQPSSWRWTIGFETRRRHQKLKIKKTNSEKVHFVGLFCINSVLTYYLNWTSFTSLTLHSVHQLHAPHPWRIHTFKADLLSMNNTGCFTLHTTFSAKLGISVAHYRFCSAAILSL
jgi:hypothetical protein